MAVSGAFLFLFVTFHALMNGVALFWPTAYNEVCLMLGANWYALIGTVVIAAFVVLHIVYASWLTIQNRKARGVERYAETSRPKQVECSSKNMFVLGVVVIAFLVIHLIQFWSKMQLAEILHCNVVDASTQETVPPAAGTWFLQIAFSNPLTLVVYLIGFIALWFHLNHGFWSMFQSVGWDSTVWIPRLKKIALWWTSIVVLLFIAQAIVFTVKAHDNYYKTDPTLRMQYKEMLVPMFEKDFGPDAAQAINAAPYEQMEQMMRGTLSQMENPEAQAYFQNDPEFPKRYECVKNTVALLDYLSVDEAPAADIVPNNMQSPNK